MRESEGVLLVQRHMHAPLIPIVESSIPDHLAGLLSP